MAFQLQKHILKMLSSSAYKKGTCTLPFCAINLDRMDKAQQISELSVFPSINTFLILSWDSQYQFQVKTSNFYAIVFQHDELERIKTAVRCQNTVDPASLLSFTAFEGTFEIFGFYASRPCATSTCKERDVRLAIVVEQSENIWHS